MRRLTPQKNKWPVCGICLKRIVNGDTERDHIIPRSYGGPSASWNLRLTHALCNKRRGNAIETFQLPLNAMGRVLGLSRQRVWQKNFLAQGKAVVWLPTDAVSRLKEEAKARLLSVSALVRQFILAGLKTNE